MQAMAERSFDEGLNPLKRVSPCFASRFAFPPTAPRQPQPPPCRLFSAAACAFWACCSSCCVAAMEERAWSMRCLAAAAWASTCRAATPAVSVWLQARNSGTACMGQTRREGVLRHPRACWPSKSAIQAVRERYSSRSAGLHLPLLSGGETAAGAGAGTPLAVAVAATGAGP